MQDLEGYCAVFPCSPNYGLHNAIGVPVRTLYRQMAFFSMYPKPCSCLYIVRGGHYNSFINLSKYFLSYLFFTLSSAWLHRYNYS